MTNKTVLPLRYKLTKNDCRTGDLLAICKNVGVAVSSIAEFNRHSLIVNLMNVEVDRLRGWDSSIKVERERNLVNPFGGINNIIP